MKVGCFGCFSLIVVILALLVVVGGALFLSASIFATPDVHPVAFSKEDGYAAQQKLYEVVLRENGRSRRKEPIILTEREANAFLSRHLSEAGGVRLSSPAVRFDRDSFFVQGQTLLRNLFQAPTFAYLVPYIPDKRLDQPVWISVRGRISIEAPPGRSARYGRVTVVEFMLGRQPINSFLFNALMGPSGGGLLRWPVPDVVEGIQIEQGQAIIRTR